MMIRTLKKVLPLGALVFMQGPLFGIEAAPPLSAPKVATPRLQDLPTAKIWIDKYASGSPLMALRKTYDEALKPLDENINAVLRGKSIVKFLQPLSDGKNKNILEFDIFEDAGSRRFNVHDQIDSRDFGAEPDETLQEETRFATIQKAAYRLIEDRAPEEFLILEMGATHALDVYFGFFLRDKDKLKRDKILQRQREIVYAANPLRMSDQFGTPGFYELVQAVDGVATPVRKVGDHSLIWATTFESRLHYYVSLKKGLVTLDRLKDDRVDPLTTIVLMDLHDLNESAAWTQLPAANDLKAAGFSKVIVGLESWMYGKSYPLNDLIKTYQTPYKHILRYYELELLKEKKPAMERRYREGITINPSRKALHQRLMDYEKAGIQVRLTGLESFEIFKGRSAYDIADEWRRKNQPSGD